MNNDEIPDNYFYQTNYLNIIDEKQFTKKDLRQKVLDMKKHPYNTIGRIISKKQLIHQGVKDTVQGIGMGCLIHPRIVLTVAHVIYFSNLGIYSGFAENIQFFHLSQNNSIKVKQCKFNQKYLSKKNFDTQIYDVAILILEEEADIKENEVMVMDNSHYFSDTQLKIITVLTILKDTQSNKLNLYEQRNTIQKLASSKMFYRHTTKSGDSGGPILIHSNDSHALIGLHKGQGFKANLGLMIKALLKQNQFLEEVRQLYKIKTKQELSQQYNISQKNQNGDVITLLTYIFSQSYMDAKDFYQYDWSKLEKLSLSNCLKTKQNLKLFFQMSILLPSLKSLGINQMKMQFKDEGIYELVKCKKTGSFKQLTQLILKHNNITAYGLKQFAENANQFNLLQQLNFSENKVDEQGIRSLIIFADKLPNLKQLWLLYCQIGLREMETLSENAEKFKNIQQLVLGHNNIGDKQFAEFCKHAHKLLNLQDLYLAGNKIGDEGWRALVEYAHNFNKLKKIELSQNKIKQINEGDLDKFQSVKHIGFDWHYSKSTNLSYHSIDVLKKYTKQHQNNGINVQFAKNRKNSCKIQ